MADITVVHAKPNPAGKDTYRNRPLPQQLQGEWVDLQNTSGRSLRLAGISLDHRAFGPGCADPKYAVYWVASPTLVLQPGSIVRIHTGKSSEQSYMTNEDRVGVHHHVWGEHGTFQLNNGACGDVLTVWLNDKGWHRIDEAGYDPFPAEGYVLVRRGDRLVIGVLAASMREAV